MIRMLLGTLAILFLVSGPAMAGDFECVWRELPGDVRAAFTRDTRTSDDINTVIRAGVLTEPVLVAAMGPCGVQDSEAQQLGQYIAARALALAQRSRLMVQHGWHESQFAALMAPVTTSDREIAYRSASGESVPTSETAERFRASARAQGLSAEADIRVALEYMYAQISVERLAPDMRR